MTILLFVGVLFVLILVHEFGHFIVAKRTGMRVDEFGIGFPPKLFGIKKGETEYTLNALPIGGFVRIYGEDAVNATDEEDDGRAFVQRSKISQALVLVAGVAMNVLFAWFLFTAVLMTGTLSIVDEKEASNSAALKVLSVVPDSPAERAGLIPGDTIVAITDATSEDNRDRGVPALLPSEVSRFIADGGAITLSLKNGELMREVRLTPEGGYAQDGSAREVIGVTMGLVEKVSLPMHKAMYESTVMTFTGLRDITVGIAVILKGALTLNADLSQVAGPVGIVSLVGDAASFGFSTLLMFTAFISLNLAVINLLPFPALDGGRLLFVAVEAVRGTTIKPQVAYMLNLLGFALLMLFMIAVTYNDIVRIIAG